MDFLSETVKAGEKWHNLFSSAERKIYQPSVLYPMKVSFRDEEEIISLEEKYIRDLSQDVPIKDGWRKFSKQKGSDKRKNLEKSGRSKENGKQN